MAIYWLNFAIGSALGIVIGAIAERQICVKLRKKAELRELTEAYSSLAGHYLNYQIKEDGSHEPTGGTVEITWQPEDGLLEASGFHATGRPEWHSYIKMCRDYVGVGIGHYNNVNSIHGGIQQILYSKQTRSFKVRGTDRAGTESAHCWKPQA